MSLNLLTKLIAIIDSLSITLNSSDSFGCFIVKMAQIVRRYTGDCEETSNYKGAERKIEEN